MQLLQQLRRYVPADDAEARHRDELAALLHSTSDPFSRRQFVPGHVTASSFIVDPATGRLLLHHHRRLRRWLQMGGHVEEGEMLEAAALREGAEESGLGDLRLVTDALFDVNVHSIPAGKGEPDHLHFDVRYLVATSEPEAIALQASESRALAWMTLGEAETRMNAAESSRAIRKIEQWMNERSLA